MEHLEKIKLVDGTLLTLVPMGIDRKNNKMYCTLITSLSALELEAAVDNKENISRIQHFSAYDEELATYTDCVSFSSMEKKKNFYEDEEGFHDAYIIMFNTDPTLATLMELQKENAELKQEIEMLTECILEISELIYE